jgi:DNA-binding NarL/FixJ family response regulator
LHNAVLFDRYRLFLDAVDSVLRAAGLDVAGKSTSRGEAVELIAATDADLFVVGLDADEEDEVLELVRGVAERWPLLKIVVISHESGNRRIDEAFAAGASAFVAKGASMEDIAVAIRQSFEHSIHLAADRVAAVAERAGDAEWAADVGLTEREREILQLVSDGESNADVARKLWITEQTVKFHLSNVYRKLDVSNRTQASRRAQQLKLVKLDDARAEAG